MGVMTPAILRPALDRLAAAYDVISAAIGDGTFGASQASADFQSAIMATMDLTLINGCLDPNDPFIKNMNVGSVVRSYFYSQLRRLAAVCNAAGLPGVTDVLSFVTYYNTGAGGPYACLLPTEFGELWESLYGVSLGNPNVYAPAVANLGQRSVGGAFAPGASVNTGFYAGAARAQATVTSWASGAGGSTLTVTGSARDASGTLQTGRAFTASITGNETITLAPTVAGDLLTGVTGITLPANMTAGTVVVSCQIPGGEHDPPLG